MTDELIQLLPILIPLAIIQFGLMLYAVIHILTHKEFKSGNKAVWLIISLVVSIIGPILYIVLGKMPSEKDDDDEE